MESSDIAADLTRVLHTEAEIHARIAEMARQIETDYTVGATGSGVDSASATVPAAGDDANPDLLLVGVLRGAVMVMADLARELRVPLNMDWMAVSSYGAGTKSSGVVRILKDLDTDLNGRRVLIVEDIIDSGLTLSWLLENLRSRGAASVEICALFRKPAAAKVEVDVRYVGFEIPNDFVVGYGLDFAERYRNLRDVAILAPHVYS